MASTGRTLGKKRVLGAGNPAPPPPPPAVPEHVARDSLIISPSESSDSLNSQVPASKSSDENDISTAVALQSRGNVAAAAAASSRLECPICNEEMVTLLQLNRHLDDDHKNLEDVEQDEVKNWFKTQMVKAKKFQPLAVLNQKFKGLDVFESNEERRSTPVPASGASTPEPIIQRQDPDELVTREHWQRYTSNGACSDPMCGKRLGGTNGSVNCRKCGKLFCEEDTMYQMKLSRSANHEPIRGFWCRVCETCYKSREGYIDHNGFERNHVEDFKKIRRKAVDKSYLEVSRLEKRMTKLTQILSDPNIERDQGGALGYLWSFSGAKSQQRQLEESVVDWEDDAGVLHCPFCQQEFSNYTFRRHHCRLCGRVVCNDPITGCSTEVGLNVASQTTNIAEKPNNAQVAIDVRMCKDCKHLLFSKSDFAASLANVPADQKVFQNLKQFEHGIRIMLPRFQALLTTLQDPENPPTPDQLASATKVRKRLTDSFTQYDIAARRILHLPTSSPTQQLLQKQVHGQASQFLHLHMLPLKALPRTLKHASPNGFAPSPPSHSRSGSSSTINSQTQTPTHLSPHHTPYNHPNGRARSPLAAIKSSSDAAADASSVTSSRLSELEVEEKQHRDRLIVLEEQRFLVQEMLADARRRRKVEEVEALGRNIEDLSKEIDGVNGILEGLRGEFEGVFVGSAPLGGK